MTSQPKWKLLANLGDASPIEHGGYFVYVDRTGVYAPEAEILYPCDDDGAPGHWTVYRFSLEQCKTVEDAETHKLYLVSAKYAPDWPHAVSQYDEWFHRDLAQVAAYAGMTLAELRAMFCSDNPLERAHGYRAIGEYYGFENLDNYPLTFAKRSEVTKRYRAALRAQPRR